MALPLLGAVGALLLAAGAVVATASPAHDSGPGQPPDVTDVVEVPEVAGPAARYSWPTGGPVEVARDFEAPGAPWLRGHRGVDLRHPAGSAVVAAADGVIAFAGPVAGRGVVSIRHDDGVLTTYEPIDVAVRRGDIVRAGAMIGTLAHAGSHCAPEPCLHWGAHRGQNDYLDPLTLLGARVVVRLYPDS